MEPGGGRAFAGARSACQRGQRGRLTHSAGPGEPLRVGGACVDVMGVWVCQ
jgi:hypothetical protein